MKVTVFFWGVGVIFVLFFKDGFVRKWKMNFQMNESVNRMAVQLYKC